jgi:tetratricopeptide (TPR) repeat protein
MNLTSDFMRSPRFLAIVGAGVVTIIAIAGGGWLWYSMSQNRGLSAYAEALTHAHASQAPQAPPESKAQAIRELEAVLAQYPSSAAAVEAAYQLGNLRYANREYAAARGAFEVALAKGARETLRTMARAGIAYSWEAERGFAQAAAAFQAALDGLQPRAFMYEDLMQGLARTQEAGGQKEAAIATYKRLLADVPSGPQGDLVRARLAALGATSQR